MSDRPMPSLDAAPRETGARNALGRSRLLRYAAYQARDFVVDRGVALCIIALFLTVSLVSGLRAVGPPGWYRVADPGSSLLLREAVAGLVPTFGNVAVLIAINGIIGNDRKLGYYRLLFAKPVSIPRYYAQAFVIHGLGAVAAAGVLALLVAAAVRPLFTGGALVAVAAQFLLFGGIGFFLSSLFNNDWLWVSTTYGVTQLLKVFYERGDGPLALTLHAVLPPTQVLDEIRAALLPVAADAGAALSPAHVLWLVGYGLGAGALGLLILHTRALGR